MKVLVYSAKGFEKPFLDAANNEQHRLHYISERLTSKTAMKAVGFDAVSIFSADDASSNVLEKLRDCGVKYITLRSAGHDNVSLRVAAKLGIKVANVPQYSPNAIAEHAIALLLAINRKLLLSHNQIKNNNFSLDNLVGFDLNKKKVGILGTGKIGSVLAKILFGFGCEILANDTSINLSLQKMYNVEYVSKDALCQEADIIMVCLPLTSVTHGLIDKNFLKKMKNDGVLVNIARGSIVNTKALLEALDGQELAGYATDVYDKESGVFFYDHSKDGPVKDSQLSKLINHPNVVLTPHQAFATQEALKSIAETTVYNLNSWDFGVVPLNELH